MGDAGAAVGEGDEGMGVVEPGGPGADLASAAGQWPEEQFELLRRILQNVLGAPEEPKFRRLKLTNARVAALLAAPGAREGLEQLGWTVGGEVLELPAAAALPPLAEALRALAAANRAPESMHVPEPAPTSGPPWVVTVLRGPRRTQLEVPAPATLSMLAGAIERSTALGVPRRRQRLLAGYPPKPVQSMGAGAADPSLSELGVRSVMLQDLWEELVADLRGGAVSFLRLADALTNPTTRDLALKENRDFVLKHARLMLRQRVANISAEETQAARQCMQTLWSAASPDERHAFCAECAGSWITEEQPEGPDFAETSKHEQRFVLQVDRDDMFRSALDTVTPASPLDLHQALEIRFRGEAAEDAGGLRREFFNEFGRSMASASAEGIWRLTPAGALVPAPAPLARRRVPDDGERRAIYRSCGRIFGMALCQAARPPKQPLLLGLPLARSFVRVLQGDAPQSLEGLQAELNAEQRADAPDFRGSAAFRERPLAELGLEGQLAFARELPEGPAPHFAPGPADEPVTEATKAAWLLSALRHELVECVEEAASAFRAGVCELVGPAPLALLSATELRELWAGRGDVSDTDLKTWHTSTDVSPAVARQAEWLFELLAEGELREARARVLKFATGSDRWPARSQGFSFVIEPMDGGDETLPCAMTCGNMLQLPRYSAREHLRDRLLQAMDWGLDLHLY